MSKAREPAQRSSETGYVEVVGMLESMARGARNHGDERTAEEAESAARWVKELREAGYGIFGNVIRDESDYAKVRETGLDRLRRALS